MTKSYLAELIVDRVYSLSERDGAISEVEKLLDILTPKDRERFAKWGQSYEQSTPEECWEEQS